MSNQSDKLRTWNARNYEYVVTNGRRARARRRATRSVQSTYARLAQSLASAVTLMVSFAIASAGSDTSKSKLAVLAGGETFRVSEKIAAPSVVRLTDWSAWLSAAETRT